MPCCLLCIIYDRSFQSFPALVAGSGGALNRDVTHTTSSGPAKPVESAPFPESLGHQAAPGARLCCSTDASNAADLRASWTASLAPFARLQFRRHRESDPLHALRLLTLIGLAPRRRESVLHARE